MCNLDPSRPASHKENMGSEVTRWGCLLIEACVCNHDKCGSRRRKASRLERQPLPSYEISLLCGSSSEPLILVYDIQAVDAKWL